MANVSVWRRLRKDPLGAARRGWQKLIVGPIKYGTRGGYDSQRYWRDRLSRFAEDARGGGHEGLSAGENEELNAEAAKQLTIVLQSASVLLPRAAVLDVGCGAGVWAAYCRDMGVTRYIGVDITDTLLSVLRLKYPTFEFRVGDIRSDMLPEAADVVLVLDVLEHIVELDELRRALENLQRAVAIGGVIILAMPFGARDRRVLFHLRHWSEATITAGLKRCGTVARRPWRDGMVLALRRLPD